MMYAHMHTNFTTKNLHLSMEVVAGDDLDKQLEDLLARPLNIHWGGVRLSESIMEKPLRYYGLFNMWIVCCYSILSIDFFF